MTGDCFYFVLYVVVDFQVTLEKFDFQNFVVRQSSHNSTMAISVRLPSGRGPYIEHYLIQGSEDNQIGLESSDNKFTSIPLLIAHYCQCW